MLGTSGCLVSCGQSAGVLLIPGCQVNQYATERVAAPIYTFVYCAYLSYPEAAWPVKSA